MVLEVREWFSLGKERLKQDTKLVSRVCGSLFCALGTGRMGDLFKFLQLYTSDTCVFLCVCYASVTSMKAEEARGQCGCSGGA